MDKNVNPKVSVLMPVFNAEKYLREAIDGILNQTFTDFEFLILNDGSLDGSEEIILSYEDKRIKYIKYQLNRGLVAVLNEGIDCAAGEYIARMDADDISLPERLDIQVKFMEENRDIGASGTAYQLFGERHNLYTPPIGYHKAFTYLSSNSSIGHPCAIIRADLLRQHNIRYEAEFQYAADYAFWIRISQISRITSIQEPLLLYRWHHNNMSNTDPSVVSGRTKARILWYELVLKRPISEEERKYLEGNPQTRAEFEAGKRIIMNVLMLPDFDGLDKTYFGKINITNWEIGLIAKFGLKGLCICLSQFSFRKWSGATVVGLFAQYLKRKG